jgi:TatD DNase family protein
MIDTHAHIDFETFDEDRDKILHDALENGVKAIIVPAVDPKDYSKLLDLTKTHDYLYCALGVHPHNANDANEDVYKIITEKLNNDKVKAIGEIGLDYYYDFVSKKKQKEVFVRQLQIASENNLPVIIHNRDADEDVLKIIKEKQNDSLRGVLHCFSSSLETMKKALDYNFNISFTGNITFKKSRMNDVVKYVPLDHLMLETDSPFMTPVPKRGKRNEPANLKFIAQKIADIKSIPLEEVIKMTTQTAKKLFNITLMLLFFLLTFSPVYAQSIMDDIERENNIEEEELIHPYPKFIGIGPVFGTNTVVETYFIDGGDYDVSYEGLFVVGGALTYGVFDYLVIELAYNYSKNKKIAEKWDYTLEPSIYQNLEFCTHWILNPYSRVNFYGTLGITGFFNSFNGKPNKQIGPNAGLGFFVNIPFDIGLLNLAAEWRINFEIETKPQNKPNVDPELGEFVDTRSFYSIPRLTILFYPDIGL